jgi:hypothetical protein
MKVDKQNLSHKTKKPAASANGLFGFGVRVRYRLRPSGVSSSSGNIFSMASMYHKYLPCCADINCQYLLRHL